MQGQKSCKHEWKKGIPYLGGRGYYLQCTRCRKLKKNWGLYPKGIKRGGVRQYAQSELDLG